MAETDVSDNRADTTAAGDTYAVADAHRPIQRPAPAAEPEVPAKTLRRAARGRAADVQAVASTFYPAVYRTACGLSARDDLGAAAARDVLRRSVRQMPGWAEPDEPARWYRRHTVLAVRDRMAKSIGTRRDVLARDGDPPALAAYLAALRKLPHQQREAMLLTYCERLGPRSLATAMDCSKEAAANHLRAAESALRPLAGRDEQKHLDVLSRRYADLTPPDEQAALNVRRQVRRTLLPRRLLRAVQWLILLTLLAAAAYGAWTIAPLVEI